MGSAAGAQQRNEIGSVGFRYEAADVPAKHRLQRLADKSREACVGIQNVAGLREDDGTLPHLFDEVTVRFLGAVQIARTFSIARVARAVIPVTYRRRTYCSARPVRTTRSNDAVNPLRDFAVIALLNGPDEDPTRRGRVRCWRDRQLSS